MLWYNSLEFIKKRASFFWKKRLKGVMNNGRKDEQIKLIMSWMERFGGLALLAGVLYFVFLHLIPIQTSTFERALDKQISAFERTLKEQRDDFLSALKDLKLERK